MEEKKGFSYLNDGKTPTELDVGDVHKGGKLVYLLPGWRLAEP